MKQANTQQEILFFTGTSFAQAELKPIDPATSSSSAAGQLEHAIWNGLLFELLPELNKKNNEGEKLFLWQVNSGDSFIWVSLSNPPEPLDQQFSVDPHLFSKQQLIN